MFSQYSVKDIWSEAHAEIDLQSHPLAYQYRSQINRGVAAGPNFAGRYSIVEIGCGTTCQNLVIVDLQSGRIVAWEPAELGSSFTLESRLLILNPDSDECKRTRLCETKYKILRDGELVLIQPPPDFTNQDIVVEQMKSENNEKRFTVKSIFGPSPVSHQASHLPTKYMREGDLLYWGSTWLMLPNTKLKVKDSETGAVRIIEGPARITIEKNGIAIHGKNKLKFSNSTHN